MILELEKIQDKFWKIETSNFLKFIDNSRKYLNLEKNLKNPKVGKTYQLKINWSQRWVWPPKHPFSLPVCHCEKLKPEDNWKFYKLLKILIIFPNTLHDFKCPLLKFHWRQILTILTFFILILIPIQHGAITTITIAVLPYYIRSSIFFVLHCTWQCNPKPNRPSTEIKNI